MQDLTFFKGREAWVGDFLNMLPQRQSILRNYVWNAAQITDANAGHHVGMGLILLSQVAPRFGLWANDGQTFSNLYTLILASTGSRKSASISLGLKVGRAAGIQTLVDEVPGSREGFIDSLDDNTPGLNGRPRQALVYSEFADFLNITATAAKGRQGGHAASLRGAIMNAYDGVSMERVLSAHREQGSASVVQDPRGTKHPVVSLIGAANYHVLSAATMQSDWLNGFMGRFLFIDGEMQRFYFRPQPWPDTMQDVIAALSTRLTWERDRVMQQTPVFPPPCNALPYTDLADDAYAALESWSHGMHLQTQKESSILVAAAMPRLLPLCYRVALLLSFDYGECSGQMPMPGWRIGMDTLRPAMFLVERHLEAYRTAAAHVVLNDEERPIRDVELVLRHADAGGEALTEGEISKSVSRNDRSVSDALRTLISRGVVQKTQREGSTAVRYQIVGGFNDKVRYLPGVQPIGADSAPALFATGDVSGGQRLLNE